MTIEQLKIKLGYKTVQEMLDIANYTHLNMNMLKRRNVEEYTRRLNNIVLIHYGYANTSDLVEALDILERMSRVGGTE